MRIIPFYEAMKTKFATLRFIVGNPGTRAKIRAIGAVELFVEASDDAIEMTLDLSSLRRKILRNRWVAWESVLRTPEVHPVGPDRRTCASCL